MIRISQTQLKNLQIGKGVDLQLRSKSKMSRAEVDYENTLKTLLAAGDIKWFCYQPGSLRLADGKHYRPDFMVQLPDLTLEMHEVKGAKGSWFYAREGALDSVKVAAEKFPFRFLIVWKPKGLGWQTKVVPSCKATGANR